MELLHRFDSGVGFNKQNEVLKSDNMNEQDLRIGNLLTGGKVVGIGLGWYSVYDGSAEWDSSYQTQEWRDEAPIPLTEPWLLMLGFSKDEYQDGFIGIDTGNTSFVLSYPKTKVSHSEYFCWSYKQDRWPLYNELKYVHELQNLFYSLTGTELTKNP